MDETLIFLHIPKAAGTTLSKVLVRQFEPDQVFHVRSSAQALGPRYGAHGGTPADLEALPEEDRARLRFLLGHLDHGIHRSIPRASRYITFLREPVSRVLSHYRQSIHHHVTRGTHSPDTAPTLEAYLSSDERPQDLQARYLAGWHGFQPNERQAALERALSNLRDGMAFVGTAERFDESLVILRRLFGWRDVTYVAENVSAKRRHRVEVAPGAETLARIESMTKLDRALYDEANKLLDGSIRAYGPTFEDDLAQFRLANQRHQRRARLRRLNPVRRVLDRLRPGEDA